jgi:hypothetical protein
MVSADSNLLIKYHSHPSVVVEEYFRLMLVFHQDYTSAFLRSPILSSVFQCGMACLAVHQSYPLMAVLDFIREVLVRGLSISANADLTPADQAPVHALIRDHGEVVTRLLMEGAMHNFPRDMIQDVAVIVEIIAQLAPAECAAGKLATFATSPKRCSRLLLASKLTIRCYS